jgi:hypothetical protein
VPPRPEGVAGEEEGVADTGVDHGPVPIALMAATSNSYEVPLVRPVTLKEVPEMVVDTFVQEDPPLDEYCRE